MNENKKILEFLDESLSHNLDKLSFLNEAVACWNGDIGDFNEKMRVSYSCLVTDIINDIEVGIKEFTQE